MSGEANPPTDPRDSLALKLTEPQVSTDDPWADDVLGREQIAARLTNLIRQQSLPLTISIHGQWGTGKTFMLERWQRDLERQKFKAIYFNAWEDDFCDDPLLAILAQLADHFKEDKLKELARSAARVAIPLIRENALGILKATTGVTLKVNQGEQEKTASLDAYLEQKTTRDKLKKKLADLSTKVRDETGHPMVFIIDELDRCRPTFAIELLERVKHIFDIPNMVFVLGINRDEICKSFQSIYGDIDATVYLQRFFDMEFTLPEVDSATFGSHLMRKYELGAFFGALNKKLKNQLYNQLHTEDFGVLISYFPAFWGRLGLSLREIDHCVRSIALVGKNLGVGHNMHPWLLGLFITLKVKNPTLYKQFIKGNCLASEVMNYIDRTAHLQEIDGSSVHALHAIEAYLYGSEAGFDSFASKAPTALSQLQLLKDGKTLTHPEYLSKRTKEEGAQRAGRLIEIIPPPRSWDFSSNVVSDLAALIDLHQELVRR